jgi:hypothetical protein
MRKCVVYCDIHQRAKHPNRAYVNERWSHLPTKPVELLNLDFYGAHPTGRGRVRCLLICLDMLLKRVQLYPLKSAWTLSCLSKLRTHYFEEIITPGPSYVMMSLNSEALVVGKLFPSWEFRPSIDPSDTLRVSPPSVWCASWGNTMKLTATTLSKMAVPYITDWLNSSACGTTGFSPIKILNGEPWSDLFKKLLKKQAD